MDRIKVYDFGNFFDTIDSLNESYVGKYNIVERYRNAYTIIETDIGHFLKVLSQELVDRASWWEKEFGDHCEPFHLVVDYLPDSKTESGNEYDFEIYTCEYPE